jgi:hypothetical protein
MFLAYLVVETLALAWFNANAFLKIAQHAGNRDNNLAEFTALILVIIIMSIFLLMTGLLSVYHAFLACANLTTWEQTSWRSITYLNSLKQRDGSPFSRPTCIENIKQFLRMRGSVELDEEGGIVWKIGPQRSAFPSFLSCCNEF